MLHVSILALSYIGRFCIRLQHWSGPSMGGLKCSVSPVLVISVVTKCDQLWLNVTSQGWLNERQSVLASEVQSCLYMVTKASSHLGSMIVMFSEYVTLRSFLFHIITKHPVVSLPNLTYSTPYPLHHKWSQVMLATSLFLCLYSASSPCVYYVGL